MTTIPAQQPGDGDSSPSQPRADDAISTRSVLRIVLTVLLVLGVILLVRLLWQPITWIVIAAFVAVALAGPVNLLSRVMRRSLAITIVYLAVILAPIGIGALVLPPIVDQGVGFVNDLPGYTNDIQTEIDKNPKLSKLNTDFGVTTELQRVAQDAPTKIGEAATIIRDFGSALVSSLFAAITIYILSIFMLARGRVWIDGVLSLRSGRESKAASVALDRIAHAVGNFIAGAFVQATIAGVFAFVILTILGVPFAGALAVLYALFDLIPLVGAFIAGLLILIVTLFADFPTASIIWVIYAAAYQTFENYVVQPQIHKRSVALEPFIVIVSVLFGGTLFGVVGALLAIPVAAAIQIGAQEWWRYRLEQQDQLDTPGSGAAAAANS
uniref:Unannotated protein n=1 Tax=freshwater metagenome TaxID=449393 RepID=A0A6J5ZAZ5_9ZZZZ